MDHLLIKRATTFDPRMRLRTDGWIYRKDIGAWVDADQPNILMATGEPVCEYGSQIPSRPDKPNSSPKQPPRPKPQPPKPKPRPMSKKADIETGEDMKGE